MGNLIGGHFEVISPNGICTDFGDLVRTIAPDATGLREALTTFVGRVALQRRHVIVTIPGDRRTSEWWSDLYAVKTGERERATLLLDATLQGLTGGVLITATRDEVARRGFTYEITTHT